MRQNLMPPNEEQISNLTATQLGVKEEAKGQKFRHVSQPSLLSFFHHDNTAEMTNE